MGSDYIVSVQHGPIPPDPADPAREALARATAEVLRRARFVTGLGEPLWEVASVLVVLTENGRQLADVVAHPQALASPASAYIPPAAQFTALASAIVTLHREARDATDASA